MTTDADQPGGNRMRLKETVGKEGRNGQKTKTLSHLEELSCKDDGRTSVLGDGDPIFLERERKEGGSRTSREGRSCR